MKILLLSFLISGSVFAAQPTLFPELFQEFSVYCQLEGEDQFYRFLEFGDRGVIDFANVDQWGESALIGIDGEQRYLRSCEWGIDIACFKGDGQFVIGYANSEEGSRRLGLSGDEQYITNARLSEDGNDVFATYYGGSSDEEFEVHVMSRCPF